MPFVALRNEDIGVVDYTVERYGKGYQVVAFQNDSGVTATYRGKGNVWERVRSNVKRSFVTDPRLVWRLAELTHELEASEA